VEGKTRTFKVKARIVNEGEKLKAGMFGRVAIVYERKPDALQIPRAALLDGDGPPTVFVVAEGRVDERQVELGLSNGGWVEVVSGLGEQDAVVVIGQGALRAGAAVRVVNPPGSGGEDKAG
jgi:membrane fusion protein (multidrug efflux system)